jgi:hypothetical protein
MGLFLSPNEAGSGLWLHGIPGLGDLCVSWPGIGFRGRQAGESLLLKDRGGLKERCCAGLAAEATVYEPASDSAPEGTGMFLPARLRMDGGKGLWY